MQVQSLGWEDPLEEEMATHSSILAWRIPWTVQPGGLSPWGCKDQATTERQSTLKRDKGTITWESRGEGFQKNETAGAKNEARECLVTSRNSKATRVAEVA